MVGTKPGWNFENNGITNKDLNEIENVHYKKLDSWKGIWRLKKKIENGKFIYFILYYSNDQKQLTEHLRNVCNLIRIKIKPKFD